MSPLIRLSRVGKIAALTAIGGSCYLLRDEIKPYFKNVDQTQTAIKALETKPEPIRNRIIENLPEKIPYLLVGGGSASHSAMKAIRGEDPNAKIIIVSSENHNPYMRPALSKELWITEKDVRREFNFKWWNGKEKSIFYEIDEFYIPIENLDNREHGGVSLLKNLRLERLDPDNKIAYLANGQTIKYEKCLLAPGGTPKTLPVLESASSEVRDRVMYFRTADDFLKLDKVAETTQRIVVIGGGFLGSELTCALSQRGPEEELPKNQTIYQIFPESGNLGKVLPNYLSEWVSKKVENEHTRVIPNVEVESVKMTKDEAIELRLSDGQILIVDYIVCAVGLEPDVELAKISGLEVDDRTGGYLVNSELEARSNVWVAGDASCFYDIKLGRRRVEHHDHAIHSGRQAGQNMTGAGKAYSHQSMFWSDIGTDISLEAVGIIDSNLETVAVFADPNEQQPQPQSTGDINSETGPGKSDVTKTGEATIDTKEDKHQGGDKYTRGVVFYLKEGIVVGVLMWNLFSRLSVARRLLNEQKKYDDYNEVAKLFNIHLDD